MRTRLGAVVALVSTALVLLIAGGAAAQEPSATPTEEPTGAPAVSIVPSERSPDDPHNGTWFVLTLSPGEQGTATANLVNPTDEPVVVRLSLRDLEFVDGVPRPVTGSDQTGVGAWGAFERDEVEIGPGATESVRFTIRVPPTGVEPGDHVGAAIAETTTETADATLVQQVATRVYVTVPGEVDRSFLIEDVDIEVDSVWWPRVVTATVTIRNDGAIRVAPAVTVAGQQTRGPRAILSHSQELYVAELPAPLLAGAMQLPVMAEDPSGELRRVMASQLVVRWGFVLAAVLVLATALVVLGWWRGHESRTARLEADIHRLERLVAGMRTALESEDALGTVPSTAGDAELALHHAYRRARRLGNHESQARLALAMHATTGDALGALLDCLEHPGEREDALMEAAATYGADAIASDPRVAVLSPDVRDRLLAAANENWS